MCELPILGSDVTDSIYRLWQISQMNAAADQLHLLNESTRPADNLLTRAVVLAVRQHLRARALLALRKFDAAREAATAAVSAWDQVAAEIAASDPQLVAQGHAFHARLADRNKSAFRNLARKQLTDLVRCARMKTQSIIAAIAAEIGDLGSAAEALDALAQAWRKDLPIRLPGLREIELAASFWYQVAGDVERADAARQRASSITGVLNPYPEDTPESWPSRPTQEQLLRLAFAVARLPRLVLVSRSAD
jgi:hypothetical protein